MYDEQDRKWLYNELQSAGYKTGSYDEFKESLNNQEDRDWYYEESKKLGLEVGSADDFASMMVEPQKTNLVERVQAAAESGTFPFVGSQQGVSAENEKKPLWQMSAELGMQGRANREGVQRMESIKKGSALGNAFGGGKEPLTGKRYTESGEETNELGQWYDTQKNNQQRRAEAEYGETLKANIDNSRAANDEALAAIEEKERKSAPRGGGYGYAGMGAAMNQSLTGYHDPNKSLYIQANDVLEDAEDLIKAAEYSEKHNGWQEFWTGAGAKLKDWETWDMGISSLARSISAKKVIDKLEANDGDETKLTSGERALLDAIATQAVVNQYYADRIGKGYKVGEGVAESIPFMAEMIINPMSGAGSAAGKAMGKYIIKKYGVKSTLKGVTRAIAEKQGAKAIAKTAGATIARTATAAGGHTLGAAGMAMTTGLGNTTSSAIQRQIGTVSGEVGADGEVHYADRDLYEEKAGKAFWKGLASRTIENVSETGMGAANEIIGNLLGRGAKTVVGKLFGDNIGRMLEKPIEMAKRLSGNAAGKTFGELVKRGQYHGVFGEFMEEVEGGITSAIIVKDQTVGEVLDPDNLWDTFLQVAATSAVLGTGHVASYGIGKGVEAWSNANRLRQSDKEGQTVFGVDRWDDVKQAVEGAVRGISEGKDGIGLSEEGKAAMRGLMEGRSQDEKQAIVDYFGARVKSEVSSAMIADETMTDDERELQNDYSRGYEAMMQSYDEDSEDADQRSMLAASDMAIERDQKRTALAERIGEEAVSELEQSRLGGSDIDDQLARMMDEGKIGEGDMEAVKDYMKAHAAYRGVEDFVNEAGDEVSRQARMEMAPTRDEQGNVRTATMKNGKTIYIKGGEVKVEKDGTIDTEGSTEALTAYDPEEEKNVFVNVDDIERMEVKSSDEVEREIEQQGSDFKEAMLNEINGVNTLGVGKEVTAENGMRGIVVAEDADNYILQMEDGQQLPVNKQQYEQELQARRMADYEQRHRPTPAEVEEEVREETPQEEVEEAPTEGAPVEYENGMELTLRAADGNERQAVVISDARYEFKNGQYEESPNGRFIALAVEGEDGVVYKHENDLKREVVAYREETAEEEPEASVNSEGVNGELTNEEEATNGNNETYELSDEVDENGRQFVISPKGTLEFGFIDKESGLTPAPILLSEGIITNPQTNDGYGLVHIEKRHGDEIRRNGYNSVLDFIEEVAKNYEVIRKGSQRDGIQTYMLQLTDKHNNTLMVELSGDGNYWNINTAGVFKTSYGAKRDVVYSRHTTANQSAETDGVSLSGAQSGTTPSTSMNTPAQTSVSAGKDTNISETGGENAEKIVSTMPTHKVKRKRDGKMQEEEVEDWMATTPEVAYDYLYVQAAKLGLTAETADNMVAANLKKAETEMERAKKATGSVLSVLQRQKAAQDEVDYWKKVKKIRSQAMLQAAEEEAERTKEQRAADAARRAEIREQRRNTEMAEAGRTASERYDAAEKVEGNSVSRTIADKTKIKGHYVLVEADALTPSHDPFNGWKVSNGFPTTEDGASVNDRVYENDKAAQEFTEDIAREYDGQAVSEVPVVSSEGIVYDGNGRTMAGQIAARNNTDALYIEALMENAANFGFTEEQVQSMNHPRVVLQVDEDLPYNATTFARFNKESKKKMDNTNKAVSVAKQMTDAARDAMLEIIDRRGTLDTFFASEKAADDVVDMLIDGGFITRQEAPAFKEKNSEGQMVLSADGRNFVTNMMLGTLFDEEAIRKLGDDKALRNSLLRAVPQIAENRRLGDYALTDEINTTIDLLYEARKSGMKFDAFKRQGNLVDGMVEDRYEPMVVLLADEMSSGVDNFRDTLTLYNKSAADEVNGGVSMFEPRTKEDIKKDVVEYYKRQNNGQTDNTESVGGQQPAAATEARPESAETEPAVGGTQEGDGAAAEAAGERGAVAESREQRLQEERKQRILAEGTSYDKPFGLTPVSETMTPEEIGANVRRIVEGLKENEGSGDFEGFAYNGNYKKNAGHQVDEYLVSLSGVVPDETLRQWYESEGLKSRDDLRRLGEKLYGENVRSQKAEGETAKPTKEQKVLVEGTVDVLNDSGVKTHYVTKKGQEMLDKYREFVKLMSGGEMSERRKEREEQNRVIDEATAFMTGKSVAEARRKRLAREEKRREDAKEVYNIILSGEYNDVSLQKIRDFIDDVTPDNKYGRRLSERLPQEVERRMYERARENALDALFTRVSESTVRPNERTRPSGRRAIEAKKKELLERWAKATGNWHTDLTDFTDNTEPIGSGTDSDVYAAKDGTHVIKLSHGKPEGKRFRPDLDNIPLFNYVFPNSAYKIVGYGDFGKGFVRVLEQPIVNFSNSKPLTEQERVEYMAGLGFKPINKENTAFSNGEIIVADLQKSNIVRDAAGNISVIDADCKLHTKDVGGNYSYFPVEHDLPQSNLREMRAWHGSGADFEAFDHSHMGEGEGAQAYGWGTYVTEVEEIGKHYAETTSRGQLSKKITAAIKDLLNALWDYEHANEEDKEQAKENYEKAEEKLTKLREEDKRRFNENDYDKILYTVEIPDDNGSNYLEWDKPMSADDRMSLLVSLEKDLLENDEYYKERYKGHENDLIENLKSTFAEGDEGRFVYEHLSDLLGGNDKKASEFLRSIGYDGIKYPAEFLSGGRKDKAKNYVIFDENDLQIKDKIKFFKTEEGEVLGYTLNGEIYIDPRVATPDTPIHEYTHLWAQGLRSSNPTAWAQLTEEMKGVEDGRLWEYVRGRYPELKNEDELTEEVFAHYSGKRGRERLEADMREEMSKTHDVFEKAKVATMFHKLREILSNFWNMARDLFAGKVDGIEKLTAEDFADMALGDLARGYNPVRARAEQMDKEYMGAVEKGDVEAEQKMVAEAAREAGYNTKGYHQTANDFTVFNPRHRGSGTSDPVMPFGIFIKPTDKNIGIPGDKQMALYARIDNPIRFADRTEMSDWLDNNVEGYKEAREEYERIDKEYQSRFDELDAEDTNKYDELWNQWKAGEISEDEYQRKIDEIDSTQPLLDEWKDAVNKQAAVMKELVDAYMRGSEYDGVIIDKDNGSFGRQTTTILALDPNQVKSAEPVTYDDNGNVIPLSERFDSGKEDIRYQKALDNGEIQEMSNRISQWLSDENIEKAKNKTREEIIKMFGNKPQPIAMVPDRFLQYIGDNITDSHVYSGMGYFIDHAVNHHPTVEAKKYQNIQKVLNNPDEVKSIKDNGNDSIVFIKQIDRYNAVVIEVEKTKDGKIIWHKSFYDQKKKPYANKGVQLYEVSSGGGVSPIIRTDESAHDGSLSVLDDVAKVQQNPETAKNNLQDVESENDISVVTRIGEGPQVTYTPYDEALKEAKKAGYTKAQFDRHIERVWNQRKKTAERFAEKLNLGDRVNVILDIDELEGMNLTDRQKRAKGWYDTKTGKIYVIMDNNTGMDDVFQTILHEGVAHHGLRELFGENFDTFLDDVYAHSTEDIRREIASLSKKYNWNVRTATEEYMAKMAETQNFEHPQYESWWRMVKDWFIAMVKKIGMGDWIGNHTITENELRFVLWRSWKNLTEPEGNWGYVRQAQDIAMQAELGVGEYADKAPYGRDWKVEKPREEVPAAASGDVKYDELKAQVPDKVIMMKNGELYEIKGEDAKTAAQLLGLPLGEDGVLRIPEDMMEKSLSKLVRSGKKVAIAEPIAENKVAEDGIMLRDGEEELEGKEEDIWKDRTIGMQERMTAAKLRMAEQNKESLATVNEAVKAVGGNLYSLRIAMNLQKMYDRQTVKIVSDLARIMMQYGYMDDMRKGEVKRLLSAVKNATGKTDVTKEINTVMDIMTDNMLRRAETMLKALEKVKASKVDAKGVEVQGKLDVQGQEAMRVFKESRNMSEDKLSEAMAETFDQMESDNKAIVDAAVNRYIGLKLAQEYAQSIKESIENEHNLKEAIRKEKLKVKPDKEYIASLEDSIRQNKAERVEAYAAFTDRLTKVLAQSIEGAKSFVEAEKEKVREIRHYANSDMEGKADNEHHKQDNWLKKTNNIATATILAPMRSFSEMMKLFGSKSSNGEGYLYNHFVRGFIDARQKEVRGVRGKYAILDAKAKEIFGNGVKGWADMMNYIALHPKSFPTVTLEWKDGSQRIGHKVSQGNLMYIYMVNKMTDGRMKLRKMGITDEMISKVTRQLDPRLIEMADWLQEKFLVDTRNEYNETHKRIFGASMAAIEDYFPLVTNEGSRHKDSEKEDEKGGADASISTKTGSIIKRKVNTVPLDLLNADAMQVVLKHITDMEHWNAFAEYNRDLNILRSYNRFENRVKNMNTIYGSGDKLWKRFNELCQVTTGTYKPKQNETDQASLKFAQGVTAAKVAFRINTALKQLLSAPAYLPYVNAAGFYKALASDIVNKETTFKWCLEHLPLFEERWKSRVAGDPKLAKSVMDWQNMHANALAKIGRIGMFPNALVDAMTVSIGAHAVYETRKAQYLKEGYSEEKAERRAIQDAEIAYNETQQSSEGAFISTVQADRSWWTVMFTIFRNASMAYTRQLWGAIRNLKNNVTPKQRRQTIEFMAKQMEREGVPADKAEAAAKKRFRKDMRKNYISLATFGYIVQFAWNFGNNMWYLLLGDDDDKKKDIWKDIFVQSMFGGLEGLIPGDLISEYGRQIVRNDYNPSKLNKDMPISSDLAFAIQKYAQGKKDEALYDMFNLAVQMGLGVNPQTISDFVLSFIDICGGDIKLAHEGMIWAARFVSAPPSQIREIYFDEIGMTGEEATKFTPQQLAERYARYQVKRGRLIEPWTWGDEEAYEKEMKKANREIKERVDKFGGEEVNEAYNEIVSEVAPMKEMVKEANKVMKTDDVEGAEMWDKIREEEDAYMKYEDFKDMDKNLDELVKAYLQSETPEDAAKYQKAIGDYKKAMVEAMQAYGTSDYDALADKASNLYYEARPEEE